MFVMRCLLLYTSLCLFLVSSINVCSAVSLILLSTHRFLKLIICDVASSSSFTPTRLCFLQLTPPPLVLISSYHYLYTQEDSSVSDDRLHSTPSTSIIWCQKMLTMMLPGSRFEDSRCLLEVRSVSQVRTVRDGTVRTF